jgi:eukaryotic-like serine/threonine-protein kinase
LQKLGKYEILTELGHGAMGVVYKARDPFIGRLVALKTINSNLVDRPDLLERFYQEAQSAGKLQHPNIVTVFELGQEKDTPFIAMEYLDGDSLEKTIVRQTELPLALKVGYVVRICQALEYAHKNRVVHRDIKPGNIMVNSEGVVKVVDFGIARLVDFSRTHTNMMIGTPAYMAPELFRKKKADERTDIWAVGVTFYELICYQRPFTGDGYDIIRTIMEDEFPPISSIVPDCNSEIESIIQRMLRKQAADRYQSMEDVLLDLEPVWNQLRANAAVSLAERAREFYDLGDLSTAYDTVRRARQIDPANAQVKSLLEKITTEIRRSEIQPKVQEHLSRGRSFLQSGQFPEAQVEAEAALGLDSHHELAQKLIAEVEAAAARAQQLEQKLRLTKQRLAEGALVEAGSALRQAIDLDPSHPQAVELKRQIEEEQTRRERRKQLSEILHRARELWTDLKYDECLALTSEGLKAFPNEPELRNLHETARADQAEQKKQVHISEVRRLLGQRKLADARKALEVLSREQPQDTTVRNLQTLLSQEEQEEKRKKRLEEELAGLRSLVSAGKLREAVAKGEGLFKEFPQEYEVNDLVTYARSEVAQQEQKKNELEREKLVRGLVEAKRYREAGEAARRALQEFPRQDVFRNLATEAEEKWKEQQEKEKVQREVQQRIQEIRSKIKRQELSDAIDMARQTLATFGPDTDVTQLLQAAEVEADQRNRKRDERSQQIKAARSLVEQQDFAGATQILERAIASRIVEPTDTQTKILLAEIAEKEEVFRKEQQKRKKEEERKREERNKEEEKKRKEAQKQSRAESKAPRPAAGGEKPSAGHDSGGPTQPLPPAVVPPVVGPTFMESATSLASTGPRPKPSVPVMTPLPTMVPQPTLIQTQVHIEEHRAVSPIVLPPPNPFRKPGVLALLGLVLLAIVTVGLYVHFHKPKPPEPVVDNSKGQRELDLQRESQDLRKEGRLDEVLAKDQEIVQEDGPLSPWAKTDAESIERLKQQENSLMTEAKAADDKKEYKQAEKIYQQVMDLHGAREAEARAAKDYVVLLEKGVSQETLAQGLFDRGAEAFKRRDYPTAERFFQDADKQGPQNWGPRAQAQGYVKRCEARLNQQSSLREAQTRFGAKEYKDARDSASKAENVPDGDAEFQRQAQTVLQQIRDREEQKRAFDEGARLESAGQRDAAKAQYEHAENLSNGDPEISSHAKEGIKRIDGYHPLPPPPPKNYDAQLQEADRYVSEGQWDNGEKSLNGVPETQPRYQELKRQIADGRQEDKDFSQKITEVTQAEVGKNIGELRHLQAFFATWANKPGRHSAEANSVVKQIEANLKPPVNEDVEIKKALDAYAKAYDAGDLAGVRALRQWTSAEEKGFLDSRKYTKGKGFTLTDCNNLKINGDDANISCEETFAKDSSIGRRRYNITLSHRRGAWIIISFQQQ